VNDETSEVIVAIDVDTKGSPGELMQRLARKLEQRRPRLQELHDRYRGNPPLPEGAENVREAYQRFQRKSRTNFAELIVEAPRERMTPTGFRTAADDDGNGDAEAKRIADANGLAVEWADVAEDMLSMGDGYMMVGGVDSAIGAPVITGEDPRQVVTIHDPVRQRLVRAGLKLFHDDDADVDFAYLYKLGDRLSDGTLGPAEVWVAYREVRRTLRNRSMTWSPRQFTWDESMTSDLPHTEVPIVRFRNRRGVGEFESHTDLLDRINHMILSRMVIAAMQAYRQRALKNAPTHDDTGTLIDYAEIFQADPGAIWTIPPGQPGQAAMEFWESGQVELGPILASVKDDVRDLAAVTRTPLSYLMPDAAGQSAEGAALMREGLVFKVEDRIARASEGLRDVMHLAFLTAGDVERADRSRIEVLWAPPERRSLAEMADAESKTQSLPFRTRMAKVWGATPSEIDRMEAERAADLLATPPAAGG
jgi:hypothetical protein